MTMLLVYGKLPLVFAGMLCAMAVMWTRNPVPSGLGVIFLLTSMSFDLVDGWFAFLLYVFSPMITWRVDQPPQNNEGRSA